MSGNDEDDLTAAASAANGNNGSGNQTGSSNATGVTLPGEDSNNGNVGKNGISIKWPQHPGEYGVKGAQKHKQWKNTVKSIMWMKSVDEKTAAVLTQMYATGNSVKFLKDIEFDQLEWTNVLKILDFHFGGDLDDEAADAEKEFRNCARRYGEPVREYLTRLEHVKKEYLRKEEGSAVAPRAYAVQMLRRSGLSRFDQRAVLAHVGGKWDAEKIKGHLETVYKTVEGNDKTTVHKGRNFKRGVRKTFVVGVTPLEPDDVNEEFDAKAEEEDVEDQKQHEESQEYDNNEWTDYSGDWGSDQNANPTFYGGVDGSDPTNEPNQNDHGYDGGDGFWYDSDGYGCTDENNEYFTTYFGSWVPTDESGRLVFDDDKGGVTSYDWNDPVDEEPKVEEADDDDESVASSQDSDPAATFLAKAMTRRKKKANPRGFTSGHQKTLFIPSHRGTCGDCLNKDLNGKTVPDHWAGDPGCPLVQLPEGHPRKRPLHAAYSKPRKGKGKGKGGSKGGRSKGKGKGKGGSKGGSKGGKSSKGKSKGKGSKGKSHGVFMADNPSAVNDDNTQENSFVFADARSNSGVEWEHVAPPGASSITTDDSVELMSQAPCDLTSDELILQNMAMERSQQETLKVLWKNRPPSIPCTPGGVKRFLKHLDEQGFSDEVVDMAATLSDIFLCVSDEPKVSKQKVETDTTPLPTVFELVEDEPDVVDCDVPPPMASAGAGSSSSSVPPPPKQHSTKRREKQTQADDKRDVQPWSQISFTCEPCHCILRAEQFKDHGKSGRHKKKLEEYVPTKDAPMYSWFVAGNQNNQRLDLPDPQDVLLDKDDTESLCPSVPGSDHYWDAVERAERVRKKGSVDLRSQMTKDAESAMLKMDRLQRQNYAARFADRLLEMEREESEILVRAARAKKRAEERRRTELEERLQSTKPKHEGTKVQHCPECWTLLESLTSKDGTVTWFCPNDKCDPMPPLVRMTSAEKAQMKQPGVNPWNDFCHSLKDMGFSSDQLRDMYRQHKDELKKRQAGTPSKETEYEKLLRVKRSRDGAEVPVKAAPASLKPTAYSGPSSSASTVNAPSRVTFPLDLNIATKEQLMQVDGLGPALADNIIAYRNDNKYFASVQELKKVRNIGKVTLDKIKDSFFVKPKA